MKVASRPRSWRRSRGTACARLDDGRYTMKFDRESFHGGDGIDVEAALARIQVPALLIRGGLSRIMTAGGGGTRNALRTR